MSLGACIPGMVKRGEIDPKRGKRMGELFDELEAFYGRSMGPDAAASEASEATLKQLRAEARLKRRQTLLQIARQGDALKELDRFDGADRYAAIRALLDDDDRAAYRGGNIATSTTRIEFGVHRQIKDFIERHRRTMLGKPSDASGLSDVVRELHGQATGNERAKTFADGLSEAFEGLRQRFNAAGGNIRKLEGFGLPHRHDALKVRAVSRDQWIGDILPELDQTKMFDERTGKPFTADGLNKTLSDVYETIRTNGLTGPASSAFQSSGKLASRRAEHRFLHFRDGDAWLRYDAKYGSGDTPFTTVMGHVAGMSHDIAIMERLGPNPDATVRYLLDHVDKSEAQSGKKIVGSVRGLAGGRKRTEDLWNYSKGTSTVQVLPEGFMETPGYYAIRGVQGSRNLLVARKLGSAAITALTGDVKTSAAARSVYGLSAISEVNSGLMAQAFRVLPEVKVLETYLKQIGPKNRDLATRLGLGMHDAAQSMTSIARFYGESAGPGWTQVVADATLRASGLNKITEMGQNAMGVEVLRTLGAHRHLEWDRLPGELRGAMERSGIDKFDWTDIRQSKPIKSGGVEHVDPYATMDPKAGDRLMNFVLRARATAVQESTISSRSATQLGTNPGTLGGEFLRNSLQFKGFAVALAMKHMRIMQSLGPTRAASYAAQFFIGMTISGAATIQLRELAKGNDPRPMNDRGFWLDAALQGGGLGILGDIIGAVSGDRINGWGEFLAGPFGSDLKDLKGIFTTAMPGKEREDGTRRDANPGGAAVRAVQHFTPGSNIWYLRAAWERMVIDRLREQVDPNAELVTARSDAYLAKRGQGAWWAPGQTTPERAPDMANALGREEADQ